MDSLGTSTVGKTTAENTQHKKLAVAFLQGVLILPCTQARELLEYIPARKLMSATLGVVHDAMLGYSVHYPTEHMDALQINATLLRAGALSNPAVQADWNQVAAPGAGCPPLHLNQTVRIAEALAERYYRWMLLENQISENEAFTLSLDDLDQRMQSLVDRLRSDWPAKFTTKKLAEVAA